MFEIKKNQKTTLPQEEAQLAAPWIKKLLHGAFFGHPLHPSLTDIPIGSWLLAAIFDLIWLFSPNTNAWTLPAARVAILVGLLGALGSAVTGLVDWSYTSGKKRRRGLLHALLNSGAILFYLASCLVRFFAPVGSMGPALLLSFIGLALVLVAAYIGGDLVFARGRPISSGT